MKALFAYANKPTISRNRFYEASLNKKLESSECISKTKTYANHISSVLFGLPLKILVENFYFVSYMSHFLVIFIRFFTKELAAIQEAFTNNEDIFFVKNIKTQTLVQKVANNTLITYDAKLS